MAEAPRISDFEELSSLLTELLEDGKRLLRQQGELCRLEVQAELEKARDAALLAVGGGCLITAGGLLSTLAVAHLLQRRAGLSLWASYGVLASVAATAGFAVLSRGRHVAGQVHATLPQTRQTLAENVAWVRDELVPGHKR